MFFTHDELLLFTLFAANFVAVTLLARIANSAVKSSTPKLIHNAIDTSTMLDKTTLLIGKPGVAINASTALFIAQLEREWPFISSILSDLAIRCRLGL